LLASRGDCLAIDYYDRSLENPIDNREKVEEKLRKQVSGCTDVLGWVSVANEVLFLIGSLIVIIPVTITFIIKYKKKIRLQKKS